MLSVRVCFTTSALSVGIVLFGMDFVPPSSVLENSRWNRMHGAFSTHAERQRVRVIDTEIKIDSYNSGRCPVYRRRNTGTERPFAYRLGYCPFGNCIISYACRFCKNFLLKLYIKNLHADIYF